MASPFETATREAKIAGAALGGIGLGLIVLALRGGGPPGEKAPLKPGEKMGKPWSSTFEEAKDPIRVVRGGLITCARPVVRYSGPGRNAFTQFQVWQKQGLAWVPVYASGVAGARMFESETLTTYDLVPTQQPQPADCPSQALCAFMFPGTDQAPVCGGPPQPGLATARIAIYERDESCLNCAPDFDGFASPTCQDRVPVQFRDYVNKILFV